MQEPHKPRWIQALLNPRPIIFGICLTNVLVSFVRMRQRELEIQEIQQATGFSLSHAYPAAMMVEPLLLLAAAVGLLINRWWSVLLAMFTSLRVIYLLGYLPWTAVHLAHDIPMFSWQALEKLWYLAYEPRPEYLFGVVLGVVVFAYSVLWSVRFARSRAANPAHGG